MAHAPATFKQSDLVRALKAARAAGVDIARFEIENGKIIIVTGKPAVIEDNATNTNPWDEVLPHEPH